MSWIPGSNQTDPKMVQDVGFWYFQYSSEAYAALNGECGGVDNVYIKEGKRPLRGLVDRMTEKLINMACHVRGMPARRER